MGWGIEYKMFDSQIDLEHTALCPVCGDRYNVHDGKSVDLEFEGRYKHVIICSKCQKLNKDEIIKRIKTFLIERGEAEKIKEERRWINKAVKLAEKEGIVIKEIEDGLIRFADPNNIDKEAGVYVWYKQVNILPEFDFAPCRITSRDIKERFEEIIGFLTEETQSGYKLEDGDGFIKEVETPEDAIAEVKLLLKKIPGIEKNLEEALEKLRNDMDNVQTILQDLNT